MMSMNGGHNMKALYTLAGIVCEGKQIGRKLGFPTANLAYNPEVRYPPDGVYAALVEIEGMKGAFSAILNQGRRPTVPDGQKTIEIHLLDFSEDLYGRALCVHYIELLREEKRFNSLDELKSQLARDVESARQIFEV